MLFGFMHEGTVLLDENYVMAMADILGANRLCRLMVNWTEQSNPRPGEFHLDIEIANCELLQKHGFQILLGTLWCPPFASEGQPTYVEYMHGCSLADGSTFAMDREHCRNPRHIDRQLKFEFSRAMAQTLGPYVQYAADWNEPGGWVYWPPMSLGDQHGGLRRLRDETVIPFTHAFRQFAPHVILVGMEAQGFDEMIRLMQLEQESGEDLYSILAFHYPVGRWNEYLFACRHPLARQRPGWVTEAGYGDANLTKIEAEEALAQPEIGAFIWYQGDDVSFLNRDMTLTANGMVAKEIVEKARSQRDAALLELAAYGSDPQRRRVGHMILDDYLTLGTKNVSLQQEVTRLKQLIDSTPELHGTGTAPPL